MDVGAGTWTCWSGLPLLSLGSQRYAATLGCLTTVPRLQLLHTPSFRRLDDMMGRAEAGRSRVHPRKAVSLGVLVPSLPAIAALFFAIKYCSLAMRLTIDTISLGAGKPPPGHEIPRFGAEPKLAADSFAMHLRLRGGHSHPEPSRL